MDDQAVEFYRRVRDGYWPMMPEEPDRWVSIDAARAVDEIQVDLVEEVRRRLRDREIRGTERLRDSL